MMNMSMYNRLGNAGNRYQGSYKRVLCVCSAGLLRSPTAAFVLASDPYNFNTRSVGITTEFALIPIDRVHIFWANEIVVMDSYQEHVVNNLIAEIDWQVLSDTIVTPIVYNLNIPDRFSYRDPELIELIKTRYDEATGVKTF